MKLSEVEKKLYKRCNPQHPKLAGKGGFILSDGLFVSCTDHAALCRSIGTTLKSVLRLGLVRFFSRSGLGGNVAAFEFSTLTDAQKRAIKNLLKYNDFHSVIVQGDGVNDTIEHLSRPVRSIPAIHN